MGTPVKCELVTGSHDCMVAVKVNDSLRRLMITESVCQQVDVVVKLHLVISRLLTFHYDFFMIKVMLCSVFWWASHPFLSIFMPSTEKETTTLLEVCANSLYKGNLFSSG